MDEAILTLLGSTGLGFVWGWLIGGFSSSARRLRQAVVFSAATLLYGFEVFWLGGGKAVIFFLCATVLALLLHLGWQSQLHNRFGFFN